jgi:hypothetical protein
MLDGIRAFKMIERLARRAGFTGTMNESDSVGYTAGQLEKWMDDDQIPKLTKRYEIIIKPSIVRQERDEMPDAVDVDIEAREGTTLVFEAHKDFFLEPGENVDRALAWARDWIMKVERGVMNDEWVELTGTNSDGIARFTVQRNQILAVYEDPFIDNIGCLISIAYDSNETKTVMLAGEYDIVRDEITGGKWARPRKTIMDRITWHPMSPGVGHMPSTNYSTPGMVFVTGTD